MTLQVVKGALSSHITLDETDPKVASARRAVEAAFGPTNDLTAVIGTKPVRDEDTIPRGTERIEFLQPAAEKG